MFKFAPDGLTRERGAMEDASSGEKKAAHITWVPVPTLPSVCCRHPVYIHTP